MKKEELVKLVVGTLVAITMGASGFIIKDVYASLDKKQDISKAESQYEDLANRINFIHEEAKEDKRELLDAIRDKRR